MLEPCRLDKNGFCVVDHVWDKQAEPTPKCKIKSEIALRDALQAFETHFKVVAMCKEVADRWAELPADLNYTISQLTPPDWSTLKWLIAKALASGATRESIMTTRWDISGDCENSFEVELAARPNHTEKWFDWTPGKRHSLRLFLYTRCRKCKKCLRARQRLWRMRTVEELHAAPRTWFGTFTLSPKHHALIEKLASMRAKKIGLDYFALTSEEQFKLRHSEISKEITRMLKRLRKNTRTRFKYLIVAEAHKSGLPHYHALFHEIHGEKALRWRDLATEWKLGFVNFKLVQDDNQATYLCKYLAKSMLARVRASIRYGSKTLDRLSE